MPVNGLFGKLSRFHKVDELLLASISKLGNEEIEREGQVCPSMTIGEFGTLGSFDYSMFTASPV